ncbi:MAG TPA: LLM class F420-dependent oxidoreductase [Dehalococcoidia bacterium]|nr:LLM class F420-dependent oxidoreductase [Dehalococcoidia bacterium]
MKFGAVANQSGVNWKELLDMWTELDAGDSYDSLWLMDHFVTGFGGAFGSEGPCFEGWTALGALAQATSRVKLGILVTGNTYRHPAVLAKQATTIDHISDGRLIFGLGAGWHEYEHQAFGIGLPPIKERMDRLEEASGVIKALWTEDRPSVEGNYYSLDKPPYNPPNVQQPHPPILIGGGGEKRTLRIVAKYADVANVQGTPAEVRHKFEVLDQHCEAVGRDPKSVRRTIQVPLFLNEDPGFRERVLQGMVAARGGTPEEAAEAILIGGPEEVQDKIGRYQDAGVEEIYVAMWPRFYPTVVRRFAEEVVPAFR